MWMQTQMKWLCPAQACLLGGLHSLADAELPIQTSDFYSKHMLPAKPEGDSSDASLGVCMT